MKKTLLALAVLSCVLISVGKAQPAGPKRPSAEEMAEHKTSLVSEKIGLDDKQYKKVYKLYLKQCREMIKDQTPAMGNRPPGEGPGSGMRGGPGGGGPGGMRGGPGGMGPGGMRGGPGGMPGEGMGEGRPRGEMPAGPRGPYEEPEKNIRKRDQKMKKILSAEQYSQWAVLEKEMQYQRFRDNFMTLEPDKEGSN